MKIHAKSSEGKDYIESKKYTMMQATQDCRDVTLELKSRVLNYFFLFIFSFLTMFLVLIVIASNF